MSDKKQEKLFHPYSFEQDPPLQFKFGKDEDIKAYPDVHAAQLAAMTAVANELHELNLRLTSPQRQLIFNGKLSKSDLETIEKFIKEGKE